MKNIVLIGFMGSGKSTVAKCLAEFFHKELISTDALIEDKEGQSIAEIFRHYGEQYFRDREREIIKRAAIKKDVVLDCGGGVVLNPQNMDNLRRNGILIYLAASPETIYKRIKRQKNRPLLNISQPKTRIAELINQRKSLYEQADYIIQTDAKTATEISEEIIRLLNQ